MLNLMPPAAKTDIRYARRNRKALQWLAAVAVILTAMAVTIVLGGMYIDRTRSQLSLSVEQSELEMNQQKLPQVKKEAEEISQGVKLIVQVLSKELLFSKLLQQIGALMPRDAVLGGVQLSNKIDGALDLTASAVDHKAATQVEVNLKDPSNALFDKVDTVGVTCNDDTATEVVKSKYKCQISLRAQFKADAAVTFLAAQPAAAPKTGGTR